tara:strand:+ start:117 stop:266 length:150 start_codon:yes stop_codon:yes gene_type:complete
MESIKKLKIKKLKKNKKKNNPLAKILRTPRYKMKTVPSSKIYNRSKIDN